jgi:transcriptional regulator with XRE-family HTH domain
MKKSIVQNTLVPSNRAATDRHQAGAEKATTVVPLTRESIGSDSMQWLGREIKSLRKARGLSLQKLGDACGKSVGFLSQVERSLSTPSISDLRQIAGALGVQISWFFPDGVDAEPSDGGIVVRKARRRRLAFASGISDYLLSPNLDGPLELLWSTMEPGAESGPDFYDHVGHEGGVVLRGSLDLWVGEQQFQLAEGDSFSFPSSTPHRYRNPGDTVTELVWVVTPPSY